MVIDGLTELRSKLPRATEIWAGGQCPILVRKPPADITVLRELESIPQALTRWRARHS
jgi:hypothetical protein